jgi:uncharacterized integral membrane protein (TIGR00698 family)
VNGARSSPIPGLALTALLAAAAYVIHRLPVPPLSIGEPARHPIDAMLIAIVLGILVRNTLGLHPILSAGVRYSVLKLLPLAIVLMGAKLDFFDVVRTSGHALVVSIVCVLVALALTLWLCRVTGVSQRLGILIGVGTAICGGTAIAVTAPVIEADDNETAFAVTTITLLGLVAVLALPLIGAAFGMEQRDFGVWAGVAVHSTPQVVATGFAYGTEAGDVATIVKLVRVLLLAPLVLAIGAWYGAQKRRRQQAHVTQLGRLSTLFPPFIFGFVLMALANTLHLLPDFTLHLEESFAWPAQDLPITLAGLVTETSGFVTTMSMAGVGLGVHLRGFATLGMKALYVGLFAAAVLAVFSLVLIRTLL